MLNKLPLHWQIFAAIGLAIIFGFVFPTRYLLDEHDFNRLHKGISDGQLVDRLAAIKGKKLNSAYEFRTEIKKILSGEEYSDNRKTIMKAAYHNPALSWVGWMGVIFLRALKMLVIPLILISIITGIINIGSGQNLGRLGLKTIAYYVSTSLLAIFSGLMFVSLFQPGKGLDLSGIEPLDNMDIQQKEPE